MLIMSLGISVSAEDEQNSSNKHPTVEERLKTLEKEQKELKDRGLLSLKDKRFKLGGELELEFVATERSKNTLADETDRPEGHFQLDKFDLMPRANLTDDIYLEALLLFKTDTTKIFEVYAHFSNLPLNSFLRAGIDDRFIKPNRKTEGHPLLGTAFWRGDDLGIFMGDEFSNFYWRLSLTQGWKLSSKQPFEDASYKLIYETQDFKGDHNIEKAFGLGTDFKLGKAK